MKTTCTLLAFTLLALSGCTASVEQENSNIKVSNTINSTGKTPLEKPNSSTTGFALVNRGTKQLRANDSSIIQVTITPQYEAVTAVEFALEYNPAVIEIGNVKDLSGNAIIEPVIDDENGELIFTAANPNGFFGENIPLIEFSVTPSQPMSSGETVIRFKPDQLHALLPNVENTETAKKTGLKPLVLSIIE
jgi:hypothetical protein